MKAATHRQTKDVAIRVLNLNPELVDGDAIQKGTEGCSTADVNHRIITFLNNGLRFVIKGPSSLIVDRTKPFNLMPIWRGPKDGSGLEGEEKQDARSLKLTEIDFAEVLFTTCLKDGESGITGNEKLLRHLAAKHIRLDAKIGQCLLEEKGWATLKWLYQIFGIIWLELPGTVLRGGDGLRYFLSLACSRDGRNRWYWGYGGLGHNP